jgi:prepilin-type N-terminal cleavage/methylation domain-containing protein
MSRISGHDSRRRRRGFTLVEVMVATSLLGIILTGVLAAYLFLGRNLTRLVNLQQQEVQSRITLRYFTQDVSAAIALSTMSSSQLALTKPAASGTTAVTYTYSSGSGTLVRTEGTRTQTLVTGLTSFAFTYYNEAGTAITSSTQSVKSVEAVFSSATGTTTSGTLAKYTSVSPRVLLRNKQALQ